jgi:hypothetical protein
LFLDTEQNGTKARAARTSVSSDVDVSDVLSDEVPLVAYTLCPEYLWTATLNLERSGKARKGTERFTTVQYGLIEDRHKRLACSLDDESEIVFKWVKIRVLRKLSTSIVAMKVESLVYDVALPYKGS